MTSHPPHAAHPGGSATPPLVGAVGMDFVLKTLTSNAPQEAIRTIQEQASLQHPLCGPLLGLLDHQGVSRLDAHRAVLQGARQALLARISKHAPHSDESAVEFRKALERLLHTSFPYLGIAELRDVPLAVMQRLDKLPTPFLKLLAADKQVFRDLPPKVQRQVWEFDKKLLQQDALPLVGRYKYEVSTIMKALAMDEFLFPQPAEEIASGGPSTGAAAPEGQAGGAGLMVAAGGGGASGSGGAAAAAASSGRGGGDGNVPARGAVPRSVLRRASKVISSLKEMIGSSQKIYSQVVELCTVKFRDSDSLYLGSKEASYCTLRSQLLMALHDDKVVAISEKDRVHVVAWNLDAALVRGRNPDTRAQPFSEKHLQQLRQWFDKVQQDGARATAASNKQAAAAAAAAAAKQQRASGPARQRLVVVQDEAESAGNAAGSAEDPLQALGDAAMVLRDPGATHLLLTVVLMSLRRSVAVRQVPRADRDLPLILSMLQLAATGRQMLRERRYVLPSPEPSVLSLLLPALAGVLVDAALLAADGGADRLSSGKDAPAAPPFGADLLALLQTSEVPRKITCMFVLERLVSGDLASATRVLQLVADAFNPKAVEEYSAFGASLAQRLAGLVTAGRLAAGHALWQLAVDRLLVRLVDAHPQVHEEVLRLLLAAALKGQLQTPQLAAYLESTLENSKKSRRKMLKKRKYEDLDLDDGGHELPVGWALGYGSALSDIGSDGWPGIVAAKRKGADRVKTIYAMVASQLPELNAVAAPALHAYLNESSAGGDAAAAAADRDAPAASTPQ